MTAPRLLFLALAGLVVPHLPAAVSYPADAVVDVTQAPYNADRTGVADATAAIQQALDDNDGAITKRVILYFPDGVYRISDTLLLDTHSSANGGSGRGIILQGESRDGTIIRLDDSAAGFGSTGSPKVVVDMNEANDIGGWQYVAFHTHVKDLSIDVGSGNPGAIGLDFCASNAGGLRNVLIRSSDPAGAGRTGLLLSGIPGPQLIKNVEIDGFDWSIRTEEHPHYVTTMEDIVLKNALQGGIYNQKHSFAIHRLRTANLGGPAIRNVFADAFVVITDAILLDGPAESPAIDNNGFLFARSITTTGYAAALQDTFAGTVGGANLSEWRTGAGESLFDSDPMLSLGLPVEDAPDPDRDPPSQWVSALLYGGNVAEDNFNDDSYRVQQAIDSMAPGQPNAGKRTLYLPPGFYIFDSEVVIPAYVERIVGCYARVKPRNAAISTLSPWRIAPGGGPALIIEQLFSEPGGALRATAFIRNESDRDVVLRDLLILAGQAYQNTGTGKLFLENVSATSSRYWTNIPQPLPSAVPQFDFGGQDVWARQFNSEQKDLKVRNDGGDLWILGMKNEEDGTLIQTLNGGRTELLGGVAMPLDVDDLVSPAYEVIDSSFSAAIAGHVQPNNTTRSFYTILVSETRGPETRQLLSADATYHRSYSNGAGVFPAVLPLFRSSPLSAAEHWRRTHFGTSANSGDAADEANPDGDALINILERAFGTDPLAPDSVNPVSSAVLPISGENYLSLGFVQLTGGTGTPGIDYTMAGLQYAVEFSELLTTGSWTSATAPLSVHAGPVDLGNGFESITIRSTEPLGPAAPSQFLRLRVQAP